MTAETTSPVVEWAWNREQNNGKACVENSASPGAAGEGADSAGLRSPRRGHGQAHQTAQSHAVQAVNVALTLRNWLIGYHIFEYEQHGSDRAEYGERLLDNLARDLRKRLGKRFGKRYLEMFRQFYQR